MLLLRLKRPLRYHEHFLRHEKGLIQSFSHPRDLVNTTSPPIYKHTCMAKQRVSRDVLNCVFRVQGSDVSFRFPMFAVLTRSLNLNLALIFGNVIKDTSLQTQKDFVKAGFSLSQRHFSDLHRNIQSVNKQNSRKDQIYTRVKFRQT